MADDELHPMAPVATALADALEQIGWNGDRDVIAGEVRRPSDGTTLGRVEIHMIPLTAVIVGGTIAQVTSTAFLAALREAWGVAGPPTLPGQQMREMLDGALAPVEMGEEGDGGTD